MLRAKPPWTPCSKNQQVTESPAPKLLPPGFGVQDPIRIPRGRVRSRSRQAGIAALLTVAAVVSGCLAQKAELKQTERDLQQRIKQSNEELAQSRARQSQELASLREQELPQLRGELEKAQHQAQDLQAKQEDLKHRSAQLEQQTKKLEQLAAKLDADSTTRYTWVQRSLDTQDAKVGARLDELSKAMDALKKDVVEAIQRTNEGLAKRVDLKFEDQQKALADTQARLEQASQKFTQFNQALTGFKEALTGLNDRLGQEEQSTKALSARIDADAKDVTAHANEVNKSVASVAKTMEAVNQKVMARLDEQDRRLESLAKSVETGGHKSGARQQNAKKTHPQSSSSQTDKALQETESTPAEPDRAAGKSTPEGSSAATAPSPAADGSDRAEYERVLATLKGGDLEGARRGFTEFLKTYPQSELAPNARFWLGESYYNKKEFQKAIETYDKVRTDYPTSEKAPAAMLKKGYAYLAMNDKKQASSAFKQVVTLYPKSPEAGKATDKLAQLKETR